MPDVREGVFCDEGDGDWSVVEARWSVMRDDQACVVVTGCPPGYVRDLLDAADGASVEDVKAGLALLRLVASDHDLHVWAMMDGGFVVQAQPPVGRTISASGPSPAAAVLALAAKVEDGRDA